MKDYPVVGITEQSIAHAREFAGDLKAFNCWNRDSWDEAWLRRVAQGIAALHSVVAPTADPYKTAARMMYSMPRAQLDRAADELAEVLMLKTDELEYHYLGCTQPEYLTGSEYNWRRMALALAYALPDWRQLPATVFARPVPYEQTPEGIAAQEDKDVEYALLTWANYVRNEVAPKLRGDYAPTVARLAKRLNMTDSTVQAALNRLGREVAA